MNISIKKIPKVIYYWWSGSEFPEKNKKLLDTWKDKNPEHSIIRISENYEDHSWVKSCLDENQYAFASDYIRCKYLYDNGGIWLDSDIECIKSFDDFFHNREYFFVWENNNNLINLCAFGCQKGNKYLKKMIDFYDKKTFQEIKLSRYYINGEVYENKPTIIMIASSILPLGNMNIFPNEFLIAGHYIEHVSKQPGYCITHNTYTKHHYHKGWE